MDQSFRELRSILNLTRHPHSLQIFSTSAYFNLFAVTNHFLPVVWSIGAFSVSRLGY